MKFSCVNSLGFSGALRASEAGARVRFAVGAYTHSRDKHPSCSCTFTRAGGARTEVAVLHARVWVNTALCESIRAGLARSFPFGRPSLVRDSHTLIPIPKCSNDQRAISQTHSSRIQIRARGKYAPRQFRFNLDAYVPNRGPISPERV